MITRPGRSRAMLAQIFSLLLSTVVNLLAGACLIRLYMQYQRIPFQNPIGRFVMALSDWIVLPLRKLVPAARQLGDVEAVGRVADQVEVGLGVEGWWGAPLKGLDAERGHLP